LKEIDKQLEIFSRQLMLKDFNEKNFKKIQSKHIVIIGLGGIGCPLAQYLVSSGIRKITMIDHDKVSLSNLNRQILFSTNDLGRLKTKVAYERLKNINPKSKIEIISKKITKNNINNMLNKNTIIVDATDNWKTMNIINNFCVKNFIPLLSTSVVGYDGQIILLKNNKKHHLCLNCIFPSKNEPELARCETVGVLGIAAGLVGIISAQMIINYIINYNSLNEKLLLINSKSMKIEEIKVKKNKFCRNNI
tara:strand:- start:858 stop:1604 length:747 start_codon:yes stop_codon:yes gene_type:complete